MQALKTGYANSTRFDRRAGRAEFWLFLPLASSLAFAIVVAFDWLADNVMPRGIARNFGNGTNLLLLALLHVPVVSAIFRRLNDTSALPPRGQPRTDRLTIQLSTGRRLAIGLGLFFILNAAAYPVAIVAGFFAPHGDQIATIRAVQLAVLAILLVFFAISLARPSQPGPNRYGPNPLEVTP